MAYVYGDKDSMKVEPDYIHKRHESLHSSTANEETSVEAPAEEGGEQ
jgi:ribosomal protein S24E